MREIMWVAFGGGVGSVLRMLLSTACVRLFGVFLPWGTLTVNLMGSFLMGVLMARTSFDAQSMQLTLFLGTGFLGGFTTFSAFSVETLTLLRQEGGVGLGLALAYVGMQVVGGVLAAGLGWFIAMRC